MDAVEQPTEIQGSVAIRTVAIWHALVIYTVAMSEDVPPSGPGETGDEDGSTPPLPKLLSELIGALQGPADLGRNHDKYLSYPDRGKSGGVASA